MQNVPINIRQCLNIWIVICDATKLNRIKCNFVGKGFVLDKTSFLAWFFPPQYPISYQPQRIQTIHFGWIRFLISFFLQSLLRWQVCSSNWFVIFNTSSSSSLSTISLLLLSIRKYSIPIHDNDVVENRWKQKERRLFRQFVLFACCDSTQTF